MKIREMLDRLDEISRRDFLKGVGATAGLAATGGAGSALGQTATGQQSTAAAAAEKAKLDQLARLKAAAGAEGGRGGVVGSEKPYGDEEIARFNAERENQYNLELYKWEFLKKVMSLTRFDARKLSPQENPGVVVKIEASQNGLIEKATVIKPSPYPDWDQAVLAGIKQAETLPFDKNGKIPFQDFEMPFRIRNFPPPPPGPPAKGYADLVRRKIKPLIVFNANETEGNPAVVVLVDVAPDGMMLKKTIVSPSTDPKWDQAVMNALNSAQSMPRDFAGKIPMRQIKLTFKPKD
jgi:TonB family protein